MKPSHSLSVVFDRVRSLIELTPTDLWIQWMGMNVISNADWMWRQWLDMSVISGADLCLPQRALVPPLHRLGNESIQDGDCIVLVRLPIVYASAPH